MHVQLAVRPYDGSAGVSERNFRALAATTCDLIMGIPVDLANPDPPDGLALTQPYGRTGYVLASIKRRRTLAALPRGAHVSVGAATAPHFYLAGAFGTTPSLVTDTYTSQEGALDALLARSDVAAFVWVPSLVRYDAAHPGAAIVASPLAIPHGRWTIAALYAPRSASFAKRFDSALRALAAKGELGRLTHSLRVESVT